MNFIILRSHLLSFLIACFVAIALFSGYKSLRPDNSGTAMASLGTGVEDDAGQVSRNLKLQVIRDSDQILAMHGRDIEYVFAAPELVRTDLPTVIWQYRSDACVLDVYFTSSRKDVSKAPVAHYEVRSRDQKGRAQVVAKDCMPDMVQSRNLMSFLDIGAIYKAQR